jgi:tyrosinase
MFFTTGKYALDSIFPSQLTLSRFALNGNPFLVRIFLGDVPEGPPFYFSDTPTQVGLVYNFSGTSNARGVGMEGCSNCIRQREEQELSTGQVILTDYLVEHIKKGQVDRGVTLETLDREDVIAYLKKNLHWRISDVRCYLV